MSMMSILPSSRFRILPLTLATQSNQGVWYDPSDLTADKIAWRRNLLSNSIFTAGWTIGGTPTITTGVADPYGRFEAVTIEDDDTGVNEYLLAPAISISNGITYTGSISVKKTLDTDYFVLRLNLTGGTQTDSRVCINTATGAVTATQSAINASVVDQGDFWRVSLTAVNLGNSTVLTLLHYPSANDSGGTSITAAAIGVATVAAPQVEIGSSPTEYQRIVNFNADFLAAYPHHALFQDAAGTTPVTAPGQPVGLMLDKWLGLMLGAEIITDPNLNDAGAWSTTDPSIVIGAGVATFTATPNGAFMRNTSSTTTSGAFYKFTIVVSSFTTGGFRVRANGGLVSFAISAPGTYSIFAQGGGTNTFDVMTLGVTTAVIESVSVRELPGNHAYQTSAPSRPTVEARVNMLTQTESLSNVSWSRGNVILSGNRITATSTNSNHIFFQTFSYVLNQSIRYRIQVAKKEGFGFFQLCYSNPQRVKCTLNLDTGEYVVSSIGGASAVVTVTDTGTGRFEVTITGANSIASGTSYFNCGPTTALSGVPTNSYDEPVFLGNGEYMDLYEPDLRLTSDSQYSYQRVNTATDYADVGAPRYLQADGVDDWMVTNNIDFTGTDKMTVWAGVRKLGGATAVQLLAELSTAATNPGVFSIFAPRSTSGTYNFLLNGNAAGSLSTDAAYPEPITNVLSCSFDISEPLLANEIRPRINGVIPTLGTLDVGPAGTGTFGNYPLYLFRRGGATLPFSGRLYGLIICGAASSMSHIVAGERWINGKTRAY